MTGIETQYIDLSSPIKTSNPINLTPDNLCWSGIVGSDETAILKLPQGVCDVYIIRGGVFIGGKFYSEGTFIAGWCDGSMIATSNTMLFFYKHQQPMKNGPQIFSPQNMVWNRGSVEGIKTALIGQSVHLISWEPGAKIHFHDHPDGEEIFVLNGQLQDQQGKYPAGTWLRLHSNARHSPFVEEYTCALLRSSHSPLLQSIAS